MKNYNKLITVRSIDVENPVDNTFCNVDKKYYRMIRRL